MALALYRKYRPATFADVVGQEHVTEPLRRALESGRINHAYLFSGPRGCGKTSSARILARSLNCVDGPTPDPCGTCDSCIALAPEGPGSLDVVELDAASHGGVDDTRDLRDRAFYVPAESRYRVFIIDEAHMVSNQGFNALLKTVEEPPEHLVFVFATTEPEKVLPTIRSRTHHYPFRLIPPATLRALLERLCAEEGVTVEPAVYPLVVKAGAGSARDSLSVMDQLLAGAGQDGVTYASAVALLGVTDAALLDETVDALAASDGASVFGAVERVAQAGHDPRRFGADLLQRLRDLVILQAVPDAVTKGLIDAPEDQLAAMTGQAERLATGTLTRFAEILHAGLSEMRGTTSPRLVLELLCARMLLPAASGPGGADGAFLQRLERLERRLEIAGDRAADDAAPGSVAAAPVTTGRTAPPRPTPPAPTAPPTPPTPPAPTGSDRPPSDGGGAPHDDRAGQSRAVAARGRQESEPARERPASRDDLGLPPRPVLSSERAAPEAPEPAPPAEPATAATADAEPAAEPIRTDVGVTDVRRVWTEILAAVRAQSRSAQALLESAAATAVRVEDGVLYLSTQFPALARMISEPGNAEMVRAALKQVLGVDWRIRCEAGDGDPGPQGVTPPTPSTAPDRTATPPAPEHAAGGAPPTTADSPPASSAPGPGVGEPDPDDDVDPNDEINPHGPTAAEQDPETAAMELLTTRLGARRLDQEQG